MIIGYARVSSESQNLARQIEELKNFGCEHIFSEKISGKNFERPQYKKMRSKLRFGDVLVVHDLSRFGRNKNEIMKEWESIIEDDIDIVVLNLPVLNTAQYRNMEGMENISKLVSDIFLSVMSWLVEEERHRTRVAQSEGIAIAKRQGKYKGRKIKYHAEAKNPKDRIIYNTVVKLLGEKVTIKDISRQTGLARDTIYRIQRELTVKNSLHEAPLYPDIQEDGFKLNE